jgi:hypothetical protein
MGNEERERKFEQALERHLRRNIASARNEADAHADVRDEMEATVACPDAATLAAFHEGMLPSAEMDAGKEHIGSCSRCREILMQLEATDEIPLEVGAENNLKPRASVLSTGALYVDYASKQTPSLTMTAPASALKAPQDISRGRGFKTLRWAAPAGAIAAGLLIWFVARDSRVQTLGHVENVQVAQEQPRNERLATPRALPASPAPEPVTKAKQLNERRKDAGKIKRPGEESGAQRAPERQLSDAFSTSDDLDVRAESSDAKARQLPSVPSDYASRAVAEEKSPEILSRQADVSVSRAMAPVEGTPAVSGKATAASGASRAQSAAPAPTPPAAPSGASSNAAKHSADTQIIETHPNGDSQLLATQQVVANEKLEPPASLKKVGFENAKIIPVPNGTVIWRVGVAGRIEQSVDRGINWRRQISGVKAELVAGSATSEAVCWVVGRSGTILRTTDGGGHWSKVVSPIPGDVAGIRAVDAMTAEIVGANKTARFITHDGGVTWEAAKD